MSQSNRRRRWRPGCLVAVAVLVVLLVVVAILLGVATKQNRSTKAETHHRNHSTLDLPAPDQQLPGADTPLLLNLRVHTVALLLRPIEEGGQVTVEASYDPALYLFTQEMHDLPGCRELRIEMAPSGSTMMALLRAKLGGPMPTLHIGIPTDVALKIVGEGLRSFSLIELGGTAVESIDMNVTDGALKISVQTPLQRPMSSIELTGSKGAITTIGLGNASPRRTRITQDIGALDLDLRGAWVGDAQIDIIGTVAAGSVWLPSDVNLLGIEDPGIAPPATQSELTVPTLDLNVDQRVGRILLIR
jgi:hypothetical protein